MGDNVIVIYRYVMSYDKSCRFSLFLKCRFRGIYGNFCVFWFFFDVCLIIRIIREKIMNIL